MNKQDFSSWLDANSAPLKAWGAYVMESICGRVRNELGDARYVGFFKIEPTYRAKAISSAIKKLEKKEYSDPLSQMSDLVGARLVVLLRTDIPIVERAIVTNNTWTVRRDRSPLDERLEAPKSFDYQSTHYIVRNPDERKINGVLIPAQMACEVQIRTVLQHAYAELGHDRIYKGDQEIPKSVHRLLARSMALMETTDEIFCSAVEELKRVNLSQEQWAEELDAQFLGAGINCQPTLEDEEAVQLLTTYRSLANSVDTAELLSPDIKLFLTKVKQRASPDNLFGKPVVLLVYLLVRRDTDAVIREWCLAKYDNDLEIIKSDLGIA